LHRVSIKTLMTSATEHPYATFRRAPRARGIQTQIEPNCCL
jgi:hypothetical protein